MALCCRPRHRYSEPIRLIQMVPCAPESSHWEAERRGRMKWGRPRVAHRPRFVRSPSIPGGKMAKPAIFVDGAGRRTGRPRLRASRCRPHDRRPRPLVRARWTAPGIPETTLDTRVTHVRLLSRRQSPKVKPERGSAMLRVALQDRDEPELRSEPVVAGRGGVGDTGHEPYRDNKMSQWTVKVDGYQSERSQRAHRLHGRHLQVSKCHTESTSRWLPCPYLKGSTRIQRHPSPGRPRTSLKRTTLWFWPRTNCRPNAVGRGSAQSSWQLFKLDGVQYL